MRMTMTMRINQLHKNFMSSQNQNHNENENKNENKSIVQKFYEH